MNVIKNKIKLIIWDLDETFWKGTLSEEGIEYNDTNHNIIIELSKRGIVNSICSKNTFDDVRNILVQKKLWDYFVFPEIDWKPKGVLVKKIIEDMGLRAENVLFIDDNLGNLNEVEFFNEGISIAEPDIITKLLTHEYLSGKNDQSLSRLKQYRVLETKRADQVSSNVSNDEFLRNSDIQVHIGHDIESKFERLFELVTRTNQLNFTKKRPTLAEFRQELMAQDTVSGYIEVSDKYGSYGISGFYLIKDDVLVHFLFSCRTMNMGIESWLYKELGAPKLTVVGETATQINENINYNYISKVQNELQHTVTTDVVDNPSKILMVGGCDLDQTVYYFNGDISTEFNYVNEYGNNVHKEHTSLIKQLILTPSLSKSYPFDLPILSKKDRLTKLDEDWSTLIYSPLNDYSRGIYKHKKTGFLLPFDAFSINWTDSNNWDDIPRHLSNLDISFFQKLSDEYEFQGPISPAEFKRNIAELIAEYPSKKFIFITGSEIKLSNSNSWELFMEERHVKMNNVLKEFNELENVEILDVNSFIITEKDHADNIRHYKKRIYAKIAEEIAGLHTKLSDKEIKINNKFFVIAKVFSIKVLNKIKKICS